MLIGEHLTVKIADFGYITLPPPIILYSPRLLESKKKNSLSREAAAGSGDGQYYRLQKQNLALPLRWTAPEVLTAFKWGLPSDVYAFGITVTELYDHAQLPFLHMDDNQLLHLLARQPEVPITTALRLPSNMPPAM